MAAFGCRRHTPNEMRDTRPKSRKGKPKGNPAERQQKSAKNAANGRISNASATLVAGCRLHFVACGINANYVQHMHVCCGEQSVACLPIFHFLLKPKLKLRQWPKPKTQTCRRRRLSGCHCRCRCRCPCCKLQVAGRCECGDKAPNVQQP